MNTKTKKIIKTCVDVVLWIFLALALIMTILAFSSQASNSDFPKIGNTYFFKVESNSMKGKGGFKKGDLIFCTAVEGEELFNFKEGDVVTFMIDITPDNGLDDKVPNTHKIIKVIDNKGSIKYRTQGINNEMPDGDLLSPADIVAKWTGRKIVGLGSLVSFLQTSTGFLVCIVLPLAAFFIYELCVVVMTVSKLKNKDGGALTKEDEEEIKKRAIAEYLASQEQKSKEENKDDNK